jgi:hypothetical protein
MSNMHSVTGQFKRLQSKAWEGSNLGKDRRRRFCEKPYAFRLLWRR